eukprot:g3645.t1
MQMDQNNQKTHAVQSAKHSEGEREVKEQRYARRAQSRSRSALRQEQEGPKAESEGEDAPRFSQHSRRRHHRHHRRYARRVSRCPSPHRLRPADYAQRRRTVAAELAEHSDGEGAKAGQAAWAATCSEVLIILTQKWLGVDREQASLPPFRLVDDAARAIHGLSAPSSPSRLPHGLRLSVQEEELFARGEKLVTDFIGAMLQLNLSLPPDPKAKFAPASLEDSAKDVLLGGRRGAPTRSEVPRVLSQSADCLRWNAALALYVLGMDLAPLFKDAFQSCMARWQKRKEQAKVLLAQDVLQLDPPTGACNAWRGAAGLGTMADASLSSAEAIMADAKVLTCAIAMAVFSKMSGRRTAVPLVLGAAALAATSFVVPGAPVQQVSARTPVTAQVKQDAASSLPGLTAGVTMGVTAAAAAANRRKPALAAELKHTQQNSTSPMEGPLRWVANMAAALLLTQGMDLQPAHAGDVVNYSDFIDSVNNGDVEMVRVQPDMLSAQYVTKEGARREVNLIPNSQIEDQLFNQLADKKVDVVMSTGEAGSPFDFLARFAGGNPFELGKSKARIIKDGDTKVKFGDVAGCDGAKTELVEVVDFLKNASRYSELGAKIPKGALLVGPPGTGKTLLAKAVAGEAGVPFFSISASEFVEVFAGVGASRVRDLFEQAKKSAPCIIFIDEIDAVGRQRSAGFGQGNDEREQTVNQLLTEMDGFESNKGVVVLAATNRADILDQALVRPGRFDRQIQVDPPDVQGRLEILKVHAKGKNLAPGIDLRRLVAYHEAGHAILGALVNDYDAVAKISIVPRGPAGGVTIFMPSEERLNSGLYSKEFLENRMCVSLGGRLAEEIINGKDNVTTGASNDFQQCTQVAKQMVMQLGMSPVIGQRQLGGQQQGGPFMGRDFMGQGAPPMSQVLKQQVDDEVKRIVDEQYQRGMKLLRDNMFLLDELAKLLMEQEKVSGEELVKLINRAAIDGKLAVDNKQMAFAAFMGEKVDNTSTGSKLTSKCLPSMTALVLVASQGLAIRARHKS